MSCGLFSSVPRARRSSFGRAVAVAVVGAIGIYHYSVPRILCNSWGSINARARAAFLRKSPLVQGLHC
eukprot:1077514-Pyramimonas_sp.AAC.1